MLWLEALLGDLFDIVVVVLCSVGCYDGRIGGEGEVNTGVGHQVRLELRQVNVQSAVETQRRCDAGIRCSVRVIQEYIFYSIVKKNKKNRINFKY